MKKLNKKGMGLNDMLTYGLLFVAVAIVLAVGGQVLGQLNETQTAGTVEHNVTTHGLTSLSTLGQWLPIIAIVIAAVIIIGILIYNFRFKR
jgi:type II secretory pathway component PulF